MSVGAVIFDITRGSFHDGPGVRDVVYLKGCSMTCLWCHNPEGLTKSPQLSRVDTKCVGCGSCAEACRYGATYIDNGAVHTDFERCVVCGQCVEACPTGALSVCGREMTVDEVMDAIIRDRDYFTNGGGVTFSGGECLLYPKFMSDILKRCRENSIHTLIESALNIPAATLLTVLPLSDYLYADLKHSDDSTHRRLTGVGNSLIIRNLRSLSSLGVRFSVRTPLIPQMNDDRENLLASAKLAHEVGAENYILLTYNPLGESKYQMVGLKEKISGKATQDKAAIEELACFLNHEIGCNNFVAF